MSGAAMRDREVVVQADFDLSRFASGYEDFSLCINTLTKPQGGAADKIMKW